jgi:hypothetical protein
MLMTVVPRLVADADEDHRRLDALASLGKPTLIVGDPDTLIRLNPEFTGTPFDFISHPFNPAEVVWRAVNLLARTDARSGLTRRHAASGLGVGAVVDGDQIGE